MRKLTLQIGVSVDDFVADLGDPLHLDLVEAHTYPTGVAFHVYPPRGA
jgi:hypothetical protein